MATSSQKVYQVAIIVFDDADILDYAAPMEILSSVKYNNPTDENNATPDRAFKIHLVAASKTVRTGYVPLVINTDLTFEEAHERLDDFDILVVPGASTPKLMLKLVTPENGPEARFVREFATKEREGKGDERVVFSVCTGSLLLAATGALSNLHATTHYSALGILKDLDQSIKVVDSTANGRARRYVDGGMNKAGVRIVTAGGNACGMDGSFFVAELKVGPEAVERTAQSCEYEWSRA